MEARDYEKGFCLDFVMDALMYTPPASDIIAVCTMYPMSETLRRAL